MTYWCWPRTLPADSASLELDEDLNALLVPQNPGYLGPQACAECHKNRVTEFQATRHFLACRPPDPATMPEGFNPGQGQYASRFHDIRFEMSRSGQDYLQTAIRKTPSGEKRSSARIAFVYGAAGKADEIFHTWHGDRLDELPISWLHPQQCWAEEPFPRSGSGNFTRTTTARCLECHNTWFAHLAGTDSRFRQDSFILGVTCEKCHGPGREHVVYHQAHPGAEKAQAITHPGRLTRERQLEVCGQCHSNTTKARGPSNSYRPGEPLDRYFRMAQTKYREEDHVVDQVKYLRQSKCFQSSQELTCITCHNPHRATDVVAVRNSCAKCHEPEACPDQLRQPAAVRGNCVDCHMPQFTRIQVRFHRGEERFLPAVRPHEHRIGVYPRARQEVLMRWHGDHDDPANRQEAQHLKANLVQEWLGEADACVKQYRFLGAVAALREAERLDQSPAVRTKLQEVTSLLYGLDTDVAEAADLIDEHRPGVASPLLLKVLAAKPDFARAHGKLGTANALLGKNSEAVEHLQAVAGYDPDDAYGVSMLGWLAYLAGRHTEALEHYRQADEIEPYNATIMDHAGMALAMLNRWEEAEQRFRQAVNVAPLDAEGNYGLGVALLRLGRPTEALRYARRAVRLTEQANPDMLLNLAEAYSALGRTADARDTAARALSAATTANSQHVPHVRQRWQQFKEQAEKSGK